MSILRHYIVHSICPEAQAVAGFFFFFFLIRSAIWFWWVTVDVLLEHYLQEIEAFY